MDHTFNARGITIALWSALPLSGSPDYAWHRDLNSGSAGTSRGTYYRASGFSVRCVQD